MLVLKHSAVKCAKLTKYYRQLMGSSMLAYLAYKLGVHGSKMLGKRTVRSPRAMIAFALTTGREDFSNTVNSNRILSLHTAGLR